MKHLTQYPSPVAELVKDGYIFDCEMPDLSDDPALLALTVFMEKLRHNPEIQIETEVAEKRNRVSRLTARLIRMVSQTKSPTDRKIPHFESGRTSGVNACEQAESKFIDSVADNDSYRLRQARIIIDSEAEPIMYYKSLGEPSAITLVPIAVNGIEIEPGTIMDLRLRKGSRLGLNDISPRLAIQELGSSCNFKGIMPVRPSGFTLPESEGMNLKTQIIEHIPGRGNLGDHFDAIKSSCAQVVSDYYGI